MAILKVEEISILDIPAESRVLRVTYDVLTSVRNEFVNGNWTFHNVTTVEGPKREDKDISQWDNDNKVNTNAADWWAPGLKDWLETTGNEATITNIVDTPTNKAARDLAAAKSVKQQQINNIPKNEMSLEDEILDRSSGKGVNDNTVKQYAKEMGITPAQAVTEMRKKRNNKAVNIGKILGRKDKYQAALDAATTVAQVNAITVDYDSAPVANKNLK